MSPDTYGTDALQKLAEHESFGTNYFTEYSADTIIDALQDVFGEDIFLQFSEWVNDPACYQNEYLPCDTTAFEQIDVFPCFGGWNFYSLSNILYEDGLRLDFAKGFRYLEEYKGYETVGIAGTIRGKEEVISFYDEQQQLLKQIDLSAEGGYVQFDIPDASYLVIEGDGGEIDFSFDFDSMAHL